MKKHPFDALSFVFGITFVALAGALSFDGIDVTSAGLQWVAAGLLLFVGVVMLIGTITRGTDRS